jgi:hypothetical protein
MNNAASFALLLAALASLATVQAAPPQTVYRCGPDGRVYSQTPCADGKVVDADDPRSSSQQKAARAVAERDAEQARKLADERRRREAAVKGQQAGGFLTAPHADAASAPVRKPKAKAPAKPASAGADATMSPLMRVPKAGAAPK